MAMEVVHRAHSLLPRAAASALILLAMAGCAPRADAQPLGGPQSVTGAAGAIYVDDGGGKEGLPVVFLHSFSGDSGHWASQLSHLRHDRRALAIDLRGHGKSAAPRNGDYRIEAFSKDVEKVVDELRLKRFVLVGHSLGAAVASWYASSHPGRVAGLVLVGAPAKVPRERAKSIVDSLEADYEGTMTKFWEELLVGAQPHVRTQVLGQINALPKPASLAIIKALFEYDPLPAIDRYPGPVLVIDSPGDDSPHDLHHLRPKLPRTSMPGTSHWPHLDRPAEFNQALEAFLAGIRQ
jgi:pimeloyl-ACP methyl ester carboxylesterase